MKRIIGFILLFFTFFTLYLSISLFLNSGLDLKYEVFDDVNAINSLLNYSKIILFYTLAIIGCIVFSFFKKRPYMERVVEIILLLFTGYVLYQTIGLFLASELDLKSQFVSEHDINFAFGYSEIILCYLLGVIGFIIIEFLHLSE